MGCGNLKEHLSMSRPSAVSLLLLVIGCAAASGQAAPAERSEGVLKPGKKPASNPSPTMLEDFLENQASELLSRRRREVAAIKTPEQIAHRQKGLKAFFIQSLGDLPKRTPLNPRIVGVGRYEGYRVERIIFESRPAHHVTALFYLPEGKPPFPGVLVPCGHSANGKAADTYQRICMLLAKNGMAAFCYDPIGQGERIQKLDALGKPAIREGSTTEHDMAGIGALLVGRQLASYRIWDGIRALDYLAGRPEIDPARLGCTGNSGGGTMTAYLMALDDRVAAAAPSCYITSLERLFATIGPQDAEQNITAQVAAGLDHADYVTMRAPKPTLLCVGTRDFFDIQGSWDTFREVKLLYGRLGFGERVDLFESDEKHGFTSPRRVASVRWLRRWLLKVDDAITEADCPIAPDKDLQCTATGQVLSELKGVSVFDLNAERERQLRDPRVQFSSSSSASAFRSGIRELLGLKNKRPSAQPVQIVSEALRQGYRLRRLLIESEPGIVIPAVELVPDAPDPHAPTVVKVGADRGLELAPGGPAERFVLSGRRVVLADLRGMGETSPPSPPDRGESLLGNDIKEAFLSIHIGRPLLGQRVLDLLCLLESLESRNDLSAGKSFEVTGIGPAGLAVLHASALDEKGLIKHVILERTLVSWTDVVNRGVSAAQLAGVLPGVLAYYDLPDLAARLNPCPLTIRHPTDALGRPVAQAELEAAYSACLHAYGNSKRLTLQAGP
jgi:dienelactone hydrolase